ncbi:MAG: ABC transporter ATP-binding protein, partial [Parabacteroides sp.]|nr:ABC transporter ATP-binding protein [Parabacteroides sp.]
TEYDILTKFIDITQVNTAVIISHRVGICKFADKIIVMKNGEIVEVGTHEQLLSNRNEYARLWYKQASWYNES